MTDEDQAHALIQRAKDEFGQADIINNASVMHFPKSRKASQISGARCST